MTGKAGHFRPEPLFAAIERRGGLSACLDRRRIPDPERSAICKQLRRMSRYGRATTEGVDRICVDVLGTLPQFIYGEEWWAA